MKDDCQRPPVRVAVLGCGRAFFEEHYLLLKAHPALFTVVAACDLLRERRDMIARDFPNCRMFRQYDDMLDEHGIDVVLVATGSVFHAEHALASLRRGLWTLVETPLALTPEEMQVLRGQSLKARGRLIVVQRGAFAPDFLLARQMRGDPRLGAVYQIRVRQEDFIRRDDWQCVKRLGGGAAYYAMPDLVLQALELLEAPPVQMWGDLKRIASLGDAEDYAHLNLRTRDSLSADIEYSGGVLSADRDYSFVIRGDRGTFKVRPGERVGTLDAIDPKFVFPRRRSAVRTPDIVDLHETFPTVSEQIELDRGTPFGISAFWRHVYDSVRVATPFPVPLEDSFEAAKFSCLLKKTSPFGK